MNKILFTSVVALFVLGVELSGPISLAETTQPNVLPVILDKYMSAPSGEDFQAAAIKFREKKFDEAIAIYSKILQTQPKNKEALCFRGAALGLSGKVEQGLADLKASLELDPKYAPAWYVEGMLNSTASDKKLAAMGDYGIASRYFADQKDKAAAADAANHAKQLKSPPSSEALKQARGLKNSKFSDEITKTPEAPPAASDKDAAKRAIVKTDQVLVYEAVKCFNAGNLRCAIDKTTKALSVNPRNTFALCIRAKAFLIGNNPNGLNDIYTCISIDPTCAEAWFIEAVTVARFSKSEALKYLGVAYRLFKEQQDTDGVRRVKEFFEKLDRQS